MAFSFSSERVFIAALVLISTCLPAKADIRVVNQCPYELTVVYVESGEAEQRIRVAPGSNVALGLPTPWSGSMWASQYADISNSDATIAEFSIGLTSLDFYDITVVNAYNEAIMINPVLLAGGAVRHGLGCGTASCDIPDLSKVCQLSNVYGGPGNTSCINSDGAGGEDTPSIDLFRSACPGAYITSFDDVNALNSCNTGSNYDTIWCL